MPASTLITLTRGPLVENHHMGNVCVVNHLDELIAYTGNPTRMSYYRSCSKPIQALPVLLLGLHTKFGLTEPEIAIMGGSVAGEARHIKTFESIAAKAGLREDDLIYNPCYPDSVAQRDRMIKEGLPPRKFCHNCSGKHLALMMVQRELGGDLHDYFRVHSHAHNVVVAVISAMSSYPLDDIAIGIDGCGVPVFGVPLQNIAVSGMRMANPDAIKDDDLRCAMTLMAQCYGRYPWVARGEGYICTLINSDPDVIGKGGAMGVYSMGLRSAKIGLSIKMEDGCDPMWPHVIAHSLCELGLSDHPLVASLRAAFPPEVVSASGAIAGEYRAVFSLNKP